MQLELLNDQGQAASKVDAPETVFGREYNEDVEKPTEARILP